MSKFLLSIAIFVISLAHATVCAPVEQGKDFGGTDIGLKTGLSLPQCQRSCNLMPMCTFTVYKAATLECHLRQGAVASIDDPASASVMKCDPTEPDTETMLACTADVGNCLNFQAMVNSDAGPPDFTAFCADQVNCKLKLKAAFTCMLDAIPVIPAVAGEAQPEFTAAVGFETIDTYMNIVCLKDAAGDMCVTKTTEVPTAITGFDSAAITALCDPAGCMGQMLSMIKSVPIPTEMKAPLATVELVCSIKGPNGESCAASLASLATVGTTPDFSQICTPCLKKSLAAFGEIIGSRTTDNLLTGCTRAVDGEFCGQKMAAGLPTPNMTSLGSDLISGTCSNQTREFMATTLGTFGCCTEPIIESFSSSLTLPLVTALVTTCGLELPRCTNAPPVVVDIEFKNIDFTFYADAAAKARLLAEMTARFAQENGVELTSITGTIAQSTDGTMVVTFIVTPRDSDEAALVGASMTLSVGTMDIVAADPSKPIMGPGYVATSGARAVLSSVGALVFGLIVACFLS